MIQTEKVQRQNLNVPLWPLNFRTGMWAYALHRITGLFLVVYLLMHITVISSGMMGGKSAFDSLLGILQTPLWVVMDLGLVAVVFFHALNGIRLILFDLGLGTNSQKTLFWAAFAASFIGFVLAFIVSLPLSGQSSGSSHRRIKMQVVARKNTGIWAWLLQRISAVLLLGLLTIHIAVLHFIRPDGDITFASVHVRLATVLYMVVDYSLLGVALYHGLNGARNVLLDFTLGLRWEKAISLVLLLIGLVAFVFGAGALTPFITGTAMP